MNAIIIHQARMNWKLLLPFGLALGFLWGVLINHLRVEWTLNPQYGYGWAVPFLCLYLVWQQIQKPAGTVQFGSPIASILYLLITLCALLYAPIRLVEEANPGWRLISWGLALEVVGLTWLAIYLVGGADWWRKLAFPVGYFLVAIPWPSSIEMPLIQGLTRLDAQATVELLGWLGVPALQHGNVIEVATGVVGIEEACSGIRSFQATLMLSLFFGEYYQMSLVRRLGLVGGGFAMSLLFNLSRMTLLVWVAAHQGIAAIATWHDPTGITILLACFFGLWGLSVWLGKKAERSGGESVIPNPPSAIRIPPSTLRRLAYALLIWIGVVEISVAAWYDWHEARLPAAQQWSLAWPTNNPTFKEEPLADRARQILRYDKSHSAKWEADGLGWQVVFLQWNPGSTAIHLAQNHTPAVCMTAAGRDLKSFTPQDWFDVKSNT